MGARFAELRIGADRLSAVGVAIGSEPEPDRLDYSLETASPTARRRCRRPGGDMSRFDGALDPDLALSRSSTRCRCCAIGSWPAAAPPSC
jgi:hypothetical protein